MLGSWGRAVVLGLLAGAAAFFGATAGLSGLPAGGTARFGDRRCRRRCPGRVPAEHRPARRGRSLASPGRTAGALPAMTHRLVGRRRQMIEALRWLRPRIGPGVVGGRRRAPRGWEDGLRARRRQPPAPTRVSRPGGVRSPTEDGPLRDPRARTALKVAARRGRHDQRRDSEAVSAVVERLAEKESLSDEEVLESILRAMKVPATKIAVDADKRRRQLTTALMGQRALLVLDAATSAAQVRDIDLPAGCAAIVTSTDELRLLDDKPVHEIWPATSRCCRDCGCWQALAPWSGGLAAAMVRPPAGAGVRWPSTGADAAGRRAARTVRQEAESVRSGPGTAGLDCRP